MESYGYHVIHEYLIKQNIYVHCECSEVFTTLDEFESYKNPKYWCIRMDRCANIEIYWSCQMGIACKCGRKIGYYVQATAYINRKYVKLIYETQENPREEDVIDGDWD